MEAILVGSHLKNVTKAARPSKRIVEDKPKRRSETEAVKNSRLS